MIKERVYSKDRLPSLEIPHYNQTIDIYQRAFSGYPWFEDLTSSEIESRIRVDMVKPSLGGVWMTKKDGDLVGASWYYGVDLEHIEEKRGLPLREFVESLFQRNEDIDIIWQSMTVVDPEVHGQGVGTEIKGVIDVMLQQKADENKKQILYLTRIRDDNMGSIKMNETYNMQRTGLSVPSSQVPGLNHSYWFKVFLPQLQ